MMTEQEAREKWCPITKLTVRCISFECMAWINVKEPETWKISREAQVPLKSVLIFGYCELVKQ
jgi:hypothetical protein